MSIPFPEIAKIAEPLPPALSAVMPWWWWLVAAVLGGFMVWRLGALGYLLIQRGRIPALPPQAEKVALRELEVLRKQASELAAPDFMQRLHDILRGFLQGRLGLLASCRTSHELLGAARAPGEPPPAPVLQQFAPVLQACDAVKFGAGQGPEGAARGDLISSAVDAIRATLAPPQAAL